MLEVFLSRSTGIGISWDGSNTRKIGGMLEVFLSRFTGFGRSWGGSTVRGATTTSGNVLGAGPLAAAPKERDLQRVLPDERFVD
jgi:hypothetical protein